MSPASTEHANPVDPASRRVNWIGKLVLGLAWVAGGGIIGMMLITCIDVIGRAFGHPLTGSYDLVKILGVITMAGALPYTTAIKGHVAVEFFFLKLPRKARVWVDSINRIVISGLFGILCVYSIQYGISLKHAGEVSPTLQIPVFWVPWIIAFSCALSVAVVLHNLLHPSRSMLKP